MFLNDLIKSDNLFTSCTTLKWYWSRDSKAKFLLDYKEPAWSKI